MRVNYQERSVGIDTQKKQALNYLLRSFCFTIFKRFIDVRSQIEDIWDLVTNESLLKGRLKTLVSKDVYKESDLVDIALLSCILWNGVEDPPPTPPEDPELPQDPKQFILLDMLGLVTGGGCK